MSKRNGIDFNTSKIWDKINAGRIQAAKDGDEVLLFFWRTMAVDFNDALERNDRMAMLQVRDTVG